MASRFTVTNAPERLPGVDYITGTAVGPFVDTGRDIEGPGGRNLGRIYLSKDTVAEMARELGIIKGHDENIAVQAAYNKGKLDGLKEELGGDIYSIADTLRRWLEHIAPAGDPAADGTPQG